MNNTIYNTSLSRRLFAQYFFSAIIPVIILAFISYFTVISILEKNAARQIYAESRAIGLTVYDRILSAESNLITLASNLDNDSIRTNKLAIKMYSSLSTFKPDGFEFSYFGNEFLDFNLSDKQKKHLESGKRLLLVAGEGSSEKNILMVHNISWNENKYLVATLNPEYLWDITTKETDLYCVSVEHHFLVHCQLPKDESNEFLNIKEQLSSVRNNKLFETVINEETYLSNVWDVFLESNFGMNSMSVVYFMPKKEALMEYNYYIDALPLSIAITLLIVFVISSVQMRRSLTPLIKLTEGAKNIITGDYTKKVSINSNDEFAVLGETFNKMVVKIGDQISKIKALSQIDRLTLSASDEDYIAQVLIEYIPSVVSVDDIAILILDSKVLEKGHLIYEAGENKTLKRTEVELEHDEMNELLAMEEVVVKDDKDKVSYLSALNEFSSTFFLVSPIYSADGNFGVMCLGFNEKIEVDEVLREDIKEVTDRASVAFSSANWERRLFHQAHYDHLTQLPNRFLFQDNLQKAIELAEKEEKSVAVLFIDLDRFKSVNDSLGHAVGDNLLVEVSYVFQECSDLYDSIARFGGDEFTIIISGYDYQEMKERAESVTYKIISLMSQPIILNHREFHIDPSIGIAIYPQDADNLTDLMKNADTAMYAAKSLATGTGSFRHYQKQQNKETLALLELENDLRHALEREQLELYYQPKIDLKDTKIYEVEALIRWNHPEQGMVSPGVFIPLAEETGLITDIGYWVMRTACQQSKLWNDNGFKLKVAINISTDQFRQPRLYENMVAIIDDTGVNPETIELEITESSTIENFPKTVRLLNQFKEHGLKIAIDDFGTGYSSMTYLQKIPIDKLKIDKSFIDNIHLNDDSASITKAIVALGHSLSLKVVAEGVETKAQYDFLDEIDCDEAQGFFLSRPLPESELIQHILLYNLKSDKIA